MKKTVSILIALICVITMCFSGTTVVFAAEDVVTAYGTIPADYTDASAYPFVVFNADGSFKGGYSTWAVNGGSGALPACPTGGTILMRANFDKQWNDTAMNYPNLGWDSKAITIDMNGFTFDLAYQNQPMFNYLAKDGVTDLDFTIKNGAIVYGRRSVVAYSHGGGTAQNDIFDLTFDNVTFRYSSVYNATLHRIFSYTGCDNTTQCTTSNIVMNNCTFDLASAPLTANVPLFEAGVADGTVVVNMTVKGGNIIASSNITNTWTQVNNDSSSITLTENDNGEKIALTVPNGTTVPATTLTSGTSTYLWQKGAEGAESTVYTLGGGIQTEYGLIPDAYGDTSAYPFVVFNADGSFKGGYPYWASHGYQAKSAMPSCPSGGTILLRADFTNTWQDSYRNYANLGWDTKNITLDLGGHTFEAAVQGTWMFNYGARTGDQAFSATVKNGKIIYGRKGVISFGDTCNGTDTVGFTFNNVEFEYTNSELGPAPIHKIVNYSTYEASTTQSINASIVYDNCTFDLATAPLAANVPLFEAGEAGGVVKTAITVKGGNVIAPSAIKNTWTQVNNTSSSIVFTDGSEGKITLTVPTGSVIPSEPIKMSDVYYVFASPVKSDESDVYSLVVAGDYEVYLTKSMAQAYNIKGACTLYIASYAGENELMTVVPVSVRADAVVDISDKIADEATLVKAFLWAENIEPLCVAQWFEV